MQPGHGAGPPIPLLRAGTARLLSGNSLIYCSQNLSQSSVLLNTSGHILAKRTRRVAKCAGPCAPGRNVNEGDAAASKEGNEALGWEWVCQAPSPGLWDLFRFR